MPSYREIPVEHPGRSCRPGPRQAPGSETRRPEEAAQAFGQYVDAHPNSRTLAGGVGLDTVLSEWGWAPIDAGKADQADRVFTRLLKDFPDSPNAADARFNLAESAYQAKDFTAVVTLLTPLVADNAKAPPG